MNAGMKRHWDGIYQTKKSGEMSWFQENPQASLNLIAETCLDKKANIIDIGAGDSSLVDNLLALGFENITVLDVSSTALNKVKKRLGDRASGIKWVVSDLMEFETSDRYDVWHDRAVLHFLTEKKDINKYAELVRHLLKPNGYLIVSTFSISGPKECSGLDIKQYSEDSMKKLFSNLKHIKSFEESHITPWKSSQVFIYSVFRLGSDKE